MEMPEEGLPEPPSFAASSSRTLIALVALYRLRMLLQESSGGDSSWDELDSESEAEVVGMVHTSDAPWFNRTSTWMSDST
jgi:hypothetical protein